jgi:hypothetical protein
VKYDVVQQSMEEFVKTNWTETAIQYDNVAFNSDIYTEYLQLTVVFGEGFSRTVTQGCYRQMGLLLLTVKTKPGIGSARKLELANLAAEMVISVVVQPVPPLIAPAVNLKTPDLFNDNKERDGWVMAQVSCPFYYDLEY